MLFVDQKQKNLNVEESVMEVDGEKNPDGVDLEGKEKDHTSSIIEVPGCTKEQLVRNQNKDPENYKPVSVDEGFLLPSAVEMENLLQHAATVYGRCHSGGQGQSHTGSGPNSSVSFYFQYISNSSNLVYSFRPGVPPTK